MRSTLLIKLMGAFLLVIAIGALVYAYLTSRATQNAFNLYTTRNGLAWAQRLAPSLGDYYRASQSWDGVDRLLESELSGGLTGQGHGMGPGGGMGQGSGMMMGMGQRMIVVDAAGVVVGDSLGKLQGQTLEDSQLKNGAAIYNGPAQVGTLIVTPLDFSGANTPAGQFMASVNQAIISSVVIAGGIALILGAGLFFQITAPLRQLSKAAVAIAGGDLTQRVAIRSKDEFGDLGGTFNRMVESLASAETQRQHLMADVAHELRTPLAAIQGTLEGMQDGVLPLDEEQLAALHSETLLLNRLVGDLRLLSLAEAGQLKLELHEARPADFLPKIVERARPQAELKHIQLDCEVADGLPMVRVDSDRMAQVFNNLIGNALRYTPERGRILVSAGLSADRAQLEILVSDTGSGIPEQDLPFVFDRFYRADKSRTRASGGSGLGLAIVRRLVEAHGGTISAHSPVYSGSAGGYGTRMRVAIPLAGGI